MQTIISDFPTFLLLLNEKSLSTIVQREYLTLNYHFYWLVTGEWKIANGVYVIIEKAYFEINVLILPHILNEQNTSHFKKNAAFFFYLFKKKPHFMDHKILI